MTRCSTALYLQIAPLQPELAESDLRALFAPFGGIDSLSIVRDAAGTSVGYGYVQFSRSEDGHRAMQHWDGRPLGANVLKVRTT